MANGDTEASKDQTIRRLILAGLGIWIAVGIGLVVFGLRTLIAPLVDALSGFFIAGLLCAFIRPVTHWLKRRGMGNGWATAIGMLVLLVAIVFFAVVFIGPVAKSVSDFMSSGGASVAALTERVSAATEKLNGVPIGVKDAVRNVVQTFAQSLAAMASAIADFLIGGVASVFSLGINLFLGLILTMWFLIDGEKISRSMLGVVPGRWRTDVYEIVTSFDRAFSGYLIGMAIGMLAIFIIAGVGFQFIGLPYGWFLAFLIAILDFIPYVGPIMGGILAILVGLTVSPTMAILAGVIMIAGEQFTDSFLGPIIMGKAVTLHPVAVLFSLTIGIALAGFAGAILALPVASVIHTTYVYYMEKARAAAGDSQEAEAAVGVA